MFAKDRTMASMVFRSKETLLPKGGGIDFNSPLPRSGTERRFAYLDFLASFLSSAGFSLAFFMGIQPQPQSFFFSVTWITPFLF
jgi:hypothetical protein